MKKIYSILALFCFLFVGMNSVLAQASCQIVCPDDVTVFAPADQCNAQVEIDSVAGCSPIVISSDCMEINESVDLVFTNSTMLGQLSQTTINLTVPTPLDTLIDSLTFTICVNGDFGGSEDELTAISNEAGTVIDTLGDETSDDCSQFCTTLTLSNADYNTFAADGMITFTLDSNVNVNPICATNTLTASVCIPSIDSVSPVVTNDFNGTEDASGLYPVGTTEVTFTTQDVNGQEFSCSMNVTVSDTVAPAVVCPSDVTLNLDAGECSVVYNFDNIQASDACGIANLPSGPVEDLPGAFGSVDACVGEGSSIACSAGNSSIVTRLNTSSLTSDVFMTEVCFAYDGDSWNQTSGTVRLYCKSGTSFPSFLTSDVAVAEGTFSFDASQSGTVQCVSLSTPFFYDGSCGNLYAEVDASGTGGIAFMAGECNGITADGTNTFVASSVCGSGTVASFGFQEDAFFGFKYRKAVNVSFDSSNPTQSGELLAIGEYTYGFTVEDLNGNQSTCSWNVTVAEFPEESQLKNLACNNQINVSVDNTCTAVITPDMMLEGGPYGCYETYNISIEGLPDNAVSGNGTNAITVSASNIAAFVANGMAGPYKVSVIDPDNGNNKCWGNIMLEDKLAPEITCTDLTLSCDDPTEVGALITSPGLYSYSAGNGEVLANNNDPVNFELSAGYIGDVVSISVDVDIEHSWIGDLDIQVVSPSGTSVELYNRDCVTQDDIKATFADNGIDFNCSQSAVGATYAPNDPLSAFAGENANGVWNVKITDNAAGDNGTVNNVTLNINSTGGKIPSASIVDNCAGGNVTYTESEVKGDCSNDFVKQIFRTWSATDAKGNQSPTCVQTITIRRETLETLTTPFNYDGLDKPTSRPSLSCDGNYPLDSDGHPHPSFTGSPGGVGSCGNIKTTYTDMVIPVCSESCEMTNSSYKIVRQWKIVDCCTGEIVEHNQIINVMDNKPPVIESVVISNRGTNIVVKDGETVDIYTDIWGCGASYTIKTINATDNCSAEIKTYPSLNTIVTIPANAKCTSQDQTIKALDCCDNESIITFKVNVIDNVPPSVVGETSRTVSLTSDGVAKIFAESFDDGSHDGCGAVGFAVKRMDDGDKCFPIDKFPPSGDDNKQFNEMVHFCCTDAGEEPIMVQFMVCDDANCDGLFDFKENSNKDNCNVAMVEVKVQDKLAPVIVCPPPTTISCVDVAGIAWDNAELVDNMFGGPQAGATCNIGDINRSVSVNLDCPDVSSSVLGFVLRTFSVTTAAGSATCSQKITVMGDNTSSLTCDRISLDLEAPLFEQAGITGKDLRQFGYDNPTQADPYTGFDSHWCAYNGKESQVDPIDGNLPIRDRIPSFEIGCEDGFAYPAVLVNIDGLCTEAGTTVSVTDTFQFAGGACKKFLVHYEVIDNCIFDENFVNPTTGEIDPYHSGNGYYELYIEVNAFDNEGPELDCAPVELAATTCTGLNTVVTIGGTDNCTTDKNEWGYKWRVDVGADNTLDSDWINGANAKPSDLNISEFPIGKHIFYWVVNDGCGNQSTCSQEVTITPNDKKPTPYCYDGIATAIMPMGGMVELWASDFNLASTGNCSGELTFTMIPESDAQASANPYADSRASWPFDCSYLEPFGGVSAQFLVRMYVTDANGNWDYCTATLRINDNFDVCPNSGTVTYKVSGKVATESGVGVNNVDVTVKADYPEFPMTKQTDVDGNYSFANASGVGHLYQHVDYTVVPELDKNYTNGVTTLDIVMIQKHILGLESLNSPYKLIAADANSDCKITGTDLVQLRKLILGLYDNDNLPQNTSWRFVDKDYVFADANKPCGFAEATSIVNMSADEIDNFVAAKIGDVNGTASNNTASGNVATRSNNALNFVVSEEKMDAGNVYKLSFLAKDFVDVYGYQYTLELKGADFVGVEAGALNVTEENFGLAMASNGIITTSYDNANGTTLADDAVLFTMTVRATVNTNVSDVLNITSRKTLAEAYVGTALEIQDTKIEFRTEKGDVSAEKFALYQNEPNPFNGSTQIGFELPKASRATLSVYDVTGKVLYTNASDYPAGYQVVTLNKAQLNATGVMYYKLESDDNVATMKMIIIE